MIDVLVSSNKWGECVKNLSDFYFTNGSGIFARYHAFVWEPSEKPSLRGVEFPIRFACPILSDMNSSALK